LAELGEIGGPITRLGSGLVGHRPPPLEWLRGCSLGERAILARLRCRFPGIIGVVPGEEEPMRYMLHITIDRPAPPGQAAQMKEIFEGHERFEAELTAAGKMVHTERLRPDQEASRVRVTAGRIQVTDGPFAETKEALGGFYVIESDTMHEAVEWAKKLPLRDDRPAAVRPAGPRDCPCPRPGAGSSLHRGPRHRSPVVHPPSRAGKAARYAMRGVRPHRARGGTGGIQG